jgi:kynurenine formamidase
MTTRVTADPVLAAVQAGVRVFDLARPLAVGMPQSPNHPPFRHALARRHGDVVRADGGSAANDMIVTGTHVGTHLDALSHVSHCGELYGGLRADDVQRGGRMSALGVETVPPMVGRAVLLDVPALVGVDVMPGGAEITVEHLEDSVARQGTPVGEGDIVFVRSGWGAHWDAGDAYVGRETGVPGVGEAGARWLAERGVRLAGADTIAFEQILPGAGHATLPAHRVLLVEHGVYIVEALVLDELAAARAYETTVVLAPLAITGATGAPVRPVALQAQAGRA